MNLDLSGLSTRTQNALRMHGITSMEKLLETEEVWLASKRLIGVATLAEIKKKLEEYQNEIDKLPRSLYQCFNAKVKGDIYCTFGYFPPVLLKHLKNGEPLEFAVCQLCAQFDRMGGPVAAKDRGWNIERKEA